MSVLKYLPIGRNKKERKSLHHFTCHATVHKHTKIAGVVKYAKEFWRFGRKSNRKVHFGILLIGIFKITSWSWSISFGGTGPTELPYFSSILLGYWRRTKITKSSIPLGWPGLTKKCSSIFLGYCHRSLTGRFCILNGSKPHIMPRCSFLDFLARIFWGSRLYYYGSSQLHFFENDMQFY